MEQPLARPVTPDEPVAAFPRDPRGRKRTLAPPETDTPPKKYSIHSKTPEQQELRRERCRVYMRKYCANRRATKDPQAVRDPNPIPRYKCELCQISMYCFPSHIMNHELTENHQRHAIHQAELLKQRLTQVVS